MRWPRGMRRTANSAKVGLPCLGCCGRKQASAIWLETQKDMTANREQWWSVNRSCRVKLIKKYGCTIRLCVPCVFHYSIPCSSHFYKSTMDIHFLYGRVAQWGRHKPVGFALLVTAECWWLGLWQQPSSFISTSNTRVVEMPDPEHPRCRRPSSHNSK